MDNSAFSGCSDESLGVFLGVSPQVLAMVEVTLTTSSLAQIRGCSKAEKQWASNTEQNSLIVRLGQNNDLS